MIHGALAAVVPPAPRKVLIYRNYVQAAPAVCGIPVSTRFPLSSVTVVTKSIFRWASSLKGGEGGVDREHRFNCARPHAIHQLVINTKSLFSSGGSLERRIEESNGDSRAL